MTLFQLFLLFFETAAFTYGGGYAMIPLLSAALVPTVVTTQEMGNIVALAQMTPGAVGLNCATYVGFRKAAFLGSVICTLGLATPGVIIGTAAAYARQALRNSRIYNACLHGIRPLVIGLIASVVLFFADDSLFTVPIQTLWNGSDLPFGFHPRGITVFLVTLALDLKYHLGPLWLLLIAGILAPLLHLI